MIRAIKLAVAWAIVVQCGCQSAGFRPEGQGEMPNMLTNSQVDWDGCILGLQALLSDECREISATLTETELIEMLGRDDQFVIAHVILTERQYGYNVAGLGPALSESSWNGLTVDITASGEVLIDKSQRPRIRSFWIETLGRSENLSNDKKERNDAEE